MLPPTDGTRARHEEFVRLNSAIAEKTGSERKGRRSPGDRSAFPIRSIQYQIYVRRERPFHAGQPLEYEDIAKRTLATCPHAPEQASPKSESETNNTELSHRSLHITPLCLGRIVYGRSFYSCLVDSGSGFLSLHFQDKEARED